MSDTNPTGPPVQPASRLTLAPWHLADIHAHACRTYPEECCGVLMGRSLPAAGDGTEAGGVVERAVALDNEREDSRHNRYVIEPETVLQAHRQAREMGLDILGYYHSHPDHPAVPSEFDREHAWPGMSYLITAVAKGRIVDTRSWRLTDDRGRFDEETLTVGQDRGDAPVSSAGPSAASSSSANPSPAAASSPQEVAK